MSFLKELEGGGFFDYLFGKKSNTDNTIDNSHLSYKDQLKTYNISELLNEIGINVRNAKFLMDNNETFKQELMAIFEAVNELKKKTKLTFF